MNYGFSNDKLWRVKMQQSIFKIDSSSKSIKLDLITSLDRRFRNYYDSLNANLFLFNHFDTLRSNDTLFQQDFRQQINYYLSYYKDSVLTKSMIVFMTQIDLHSPTMEMTLFYSIITLDLNIFLTNRSMILIQQQVIHHLASEEII